jgi:hypothetical protein
MIELARSHHSDSLHDAFGGKVRRGREADDLLQPQLLKAVPQRRFGCLGRIAIAPSRTCKSPADLDCRKEVRLERRDREPGEPYEASLGLDRPQAPASLSKTILDAVGEGVALLPTERGRKMLHDYWISIERRKWLAIAIDPAPQQKSLGTDPSVSLLSVEVHPARLRAALSP